MIDDRYNERADVARRLLELSGTIEEAIGHMLGRFKEFRDDIGVCAGLLKGVGEGLISLENAAAAISGPMGADPGEVERLSFIYDEMCGQLDSMADACLEDRAGDLPGLGDMLRESFAAYSDGLALCFRKSAVM